MKLRSLPLLLLLATPLLQAQASKPAVVAYGGEVEERAAVRIFYWNDQKQASAGQISIQYSRPVWKAEYDDAANFDKMTKGRTWRFGKDFWTVLDTNVPLKIAGKGVAPGSYYLGLHRSADGATWSLAFVDPGRARKALLDASDMDKTPAEFKVPMTLERTAEQADKLAITLAASKENPSSAKLNVAWGKLRLSIPVEAQLGGN